MQVLLPWNISCCYCCETVSSDRDIATKVGSDINRSSFDFAEVNELQIEKFLVSTQ